MVTSDFSPEVEIRPFRACAMHPAIIIGTIRSLWTWTWLWGQIPRSTERISCYWNSSFIMDVAMGQIPRSTERISSFVIKLSYRVPMGPDLFVFIWVYFCFVLRMCCIIVSMVGWTWWDWSLILSTYLPSVLWHCWLGHLSHKHPSPIWSIMCFVGSRTLLSLWVPKSPESTGTKVHVHLFSLNDLSLVYSVFALDTFKVAQNLQKNRSAMWYYRSVNQSINVMTNAGSAEPLCPNWLLLWRW